VKENIDFLLNNLLMIDYIHVATGDHARVIDLSSLQLHVIEIVNDMSIF
jgi:hypothetical protein